MVRCSCYLNPARSDSFHSMFCSGSGTGPFPVRGAVTVVRNSPITSALCRKPKEMVMADDKKKTGAADRRQVAGGEGYEVNYFARKHGLSQARCSEAYRYRWQQSCEAQRSRCQEERVRYGHRKDRRRRAHLTRPRGKTSKRQRGRRRDIGGSRCRQQLARPSRRCHRHPEDVARA